MSTYRLEILPLYEDHPYKNITDRDDTNAGFDLFCPIDGDVENVAYPMRYLMHQKEGYLY